jgi:dihydrofolate synthase/folylpolyglutamate synthase
MLSYPESVRFLYSLGNELKTFRLGLDRIRMLLAALGDPQRTLRVVHVAGTNGKGSTCAMIESALRAAGQRTGLYTSPHLVEPTERIQVGGAPVTADQFADAFRVVHEAAEELVEDGRLDVHPTYFETITAMAFLLFRDLGVERAVVEVGLGGRLDATNVVSPELCVITPIDFDHEIWLGSSIESIAWEKAGILQHGGQAVFARQRPEALGVLESRARELGVEVTTTDEWRADQLDLHPRGCRFAAHGPVTVRVDCPLAGEHQVGNALTAVAALDRLGVPVEAVERGITAVRWPGRLELAGERPETILDGAHNPAGIRALACYIERFFRGRRVWLIYGAMRDKSLDEIAGILSAVADEIVLTAPRSPRAMRPEALRALFDHAHVRTAPRLAEALAISRQAEPDDVVFVTGSLFLIGEFHELRAKGML